MPPVLNGASVAQEIGNPSNYRYDVIGKNSEVFAAGDLVVVSSGLLKVGTVSVVGFIAKTVTMASNNQTVAPILSPAVVPISDTTVLLMGTNADLTDNKTDGGKMFSVAGATGAQQVDVTKGAITSGPNRGVVILKVDPFGLGGTGSGSGVRQVLVKYLSTAYSNIAITS